MLVLQAGVRSGPWACRSLAAAGFRVVAGHEQRSDRLVARPRYCRRWLKYPSPRADADAFLETVDEVCRRESVAAILPLSEVEVLLLAERGPGDLRARLVGPNLAQYRRLCDKAELERAAAEAGVDRPRGVIVTAEGRSGDWPMLPSIVKPSTTATPTATGVVYETAALVRTEAERTAAVRRMLDRTGGALVQEQVGGLRWLVDFVRSSTCLVAVSRLVLRSYPRASGMASVSRGEPTPPALGAATERLLRLVDYRGPGSIGFLVGDGRFLVHDVNLRLPYSAGATIAAGLDLPRLAAEEALGRPSRAVPATRRVSYVWLGGEVNALVDSLRDGASMAAAGRIAADLCLAGVLPGRVLDPCSFADPLPTIANVATYARTVARRRSTDAEVP